jgi:hypothetical protein
MKRCMRKAYPAPPSVARCSKVRILTPTHPTQTLQRISSRSPSAALDDDALLEKAARQTGLADFGGDASPFREPLENLLRSLRDEARLNARGTFIMHRTMLRLLTNRLLTEKAFAKNPAMTQTPIDRPLFILGFPRTGTTLLHNLLACDPAARWLRLWEGLYPAPPPQSLEDDPRIAQVEQWAGGFEKVAPRLATAHKLEASGPEECLWLIEHTFTDLIFELRANVPAYSKWLAEHEADAGVYRYFHRQLQMLGTHCRGRHWVFKAPRHWAGLSGLLAVFPEARIVQTHREPAAVLPSLCSLCEILRSAASDEIDKAAIGAQWQQRLMNIFQRGREARANAKAEQFLDVQFTELVADPLGAVRRIYEFHGYEYSAEFEANMTKWLADNRQHKHGTHRYTLEEFGLETAQVKTDFADYCEEFI